MNTQAWLSLSEIARMCDGTLFGNEAHANSVCIDTRKLHNGQFFIALRGTHYDAHDFVAQGKANAACGAMVQRKLSVQLPQVLVEDTQTGLWKFATSWRQQLSNTVIGLTGSNGKTTVKEMIASILGEVGAAHATQGNLNNHIGVPLTLLAARTHHKYLVVEMGANHFGEIENLSKLVRPNIAIITNAGPAHLEGFGSIAGVARGKGEIFLGLQEDGIAVLNRDDPYFTYWQGLLVNRSVITFGVENDAADVRGRLISAQEVEIQTPFSRFTTKLNFVGKHNLYNALAATAATVSCAIDEHNIKEGLRKTTPSKGRLIPITGLRGCLVLDDTYNANPESLRAALEVARTLDKKTWLVLGDMGELGADGETQHRLAGHVAKNLGVEKLYAVGELAKFAAEAFGGSSIHFASKAALIAKLQNDLHKDVCVLIKASRFMQLDLVVAEVTKTTQATNLGSEYVA